MTSESKERISVKEWQDRLTKTFSVNGVVGTNDLALESYYNNCLVHITDTYLGHNFIMGAFFDFFYNTLDKFFSMEFPSNSPWYSIALTKFVSLFRSFKAAERLFYSGFTLEAYSLLRDIKDRTFSIEMLYAGNVRDDEYKTRKNAIEKTRSAALRKLIGKESGLSDPSLTELELWRDLFHSQVHGAMCNFRGRHYDLPFTLATLWSSHSLISDSNQPTARWLIQTALGNCFSAIFAYIVLRDNPVLLINSGNRIILL